jgi:hypothetical protein
MEIVGGAWSGAFGEENVVYRVFTTIEETMELTGLVLFVHALLLHTQLHLVAGPFAPAEGWQKQDGGECFQKNAGHDRLIVPGASVR